MQNAVSHVNAERSTADLAVRGKHLKSPDPRGSFKHILSSLTPNLNTALDYTLTLTQNVTQHSLTSMDFASRTTTDKKNDAGETREPVKEINQEHSDLTPGEEPALDTGRDSDSDTAAFISSLAMDTQGAELSARQGLKDQSIPAPRSAPDPFMARDFREARGFESQNFTAPDAETVSGTEQLSLNSRRYLNALAAETNVQRVTVSDTKALQGQAALNNRATDTALLNQDLDLQSALTSQEATRAKFTDPNSMYLTGGEKNGTANAAATAPSLSGTSSETAQPPLSGAVPSVKERPILGKSAEKNVLADVESTNLQRSRTVSVEESFKQALSSAASSPLQGSEKAVNDPSLTDPSLNGTGLKSGVLSDFMQGLTQQGNTLTSTLTSLNSVLSQLSGLGVSGQSSLSGSSRFSHGQGQFQQSSGQALKELTSAAVHLSSGDSSVDEISEMVATMAARNIRQMTIDLAPAHLGQMTINLSMVNGSENLGVRVSAQKSETRALLERMLPRLSAALHRSGVSADSVSVEHA